MMVKEQTRSLLEAKDLGELKAALKSGGE